VATADRRHLGAELPARLAQAARERRRDRSHVVLDEALAGDRLRADPDRPCGIRAVGRGTADRGEQDVALGEPSRRDRAAAERAQSTAT